MEARAADAAVELAEEADDARVRAAQRLGDEEDDAVAFGERVGVEAVVRSDEAFACGRGRPRSEAATEAAPGQRLTRWRMRARTRSLWADRKAAREAAAAP